MMKKPMPDGYHDAREFRRDKRRQLRRIRKQINQLRFGSAYMPGYPKNINALDAACARMEADLSPSSWGS